MDKHAALLAAAQCQLLRGKSIADEILRQVAFDVRELVQAGLTPRLVSLTFGAPSAAEIYVRNQRRTAECVGIEFVEMTLSATTDEAEALAAVAKLDADPAITGIILQRPVPSHLSVKRLQGAIQPCKDVEGMHPDSIGQIVYGLSDIGPCTAVAAVEILRRTGLRIEGLEVVVIGHSEIVGKPIAFLLMAEGATVTVCHHLTRSVAMHSRRADAVFVAVGKPKLVGPDMIKPGAAVIDIGINPVLGDDGKVRFVGDVDFDAVGKVAGWLTPVPGGVGPVTVSILMRNTVFAARRQRHEVTAAAVAVAAPVDSMEPDRVVIRDLVVSTSVGIHSHEHAERQPVRINIEMTTDRGGDGLGVVDYETIAKAIRVLPGAGHFRLVEEMADQIAELCLLDARVGSVSVSVEKLNAVQGAAGAGVKITRRQNRRFQ